MKIVIFGLTVSSSWGNGHAKLWRGLCKALARLGYDVVFFERDVPYYAQTRDWLTLQCGDLLFFTRWDDIRERAARELADADAAIVTSYCPDAVAARAAMLDAQRHLPRVSFRGSSVRRRRALAAPPRRALSTHRLSWADSFRPHALDWFDRQMEALAEFDVTFTFSFTPEHLGIEPHHTSAPREQERYAEFCAQMVRRYAPARAHAASRSTTQATVA